MISQDIGYSIKEVQRLLIMLTAKTPISETITSFHKCLLLKLHSNANNT